MPYQQNTSMVKLLLDIKHCSKRVTNDFGLFFMSINLSLYGRSRLPSQSEKNGQKMELLEKNVLTRMYAGFRL